MEAEMNTAARVDKIVDMIAHYEKYDGRLDNTGNYLKLPELIRYPLNNGLTLRIRRPVRQF